MTKEKDNIVKLVENACDLALGIHNQMVKDYFPSSKSGGIHESNLVGIFIESVKRTNGFNNVSAWSEVKIFEKSKNKKPKHKFRASRLDAAIKLKDKDALLLIEAKRFKWGRSRWGKNAGKLNSELTINSVRKDSERLLAIDGDEPVIEDSRCKNVYRVLLSVMWCRNDIEPTPDKEPPKKKKKREEQEEQRKGIEEVKEKWIKKEIFNDEWSNCVTFETKYQEEARKYLKLLVAIDGPYAIEDMPNSSTEQTEQ